MDTGGGGRGKCSKIRHIARLRQWRRKAAAPSDVPGGHVALCVGSSSRRFVVRASHLNHPAFRDLLRQAEEEYGFASRPGPLSLPCDESLFEDFLHLISSSSSSRFPDYTLEDLEKLSRASSCCCAVGQWLHANDSLPLLHRHRLP
ncbi:hypothetical protein OPV22_025059 [Ensete ventricosum]|uniref:Uncharacterized protein n=1 Tax=Ensete ventricosum TaxID=4639 RepID=A0AAV8P726_ENSVE|nr:hypothetical protein OPV22_025059 [Ensete ventricosum]